MIFEEQRFLHEDLERLEQAIADRLTEEPRNIRETLVRDHQIAAFLERTKEQSAKLLEIYDAQPDPRTTELMSMSAGDPFVEFYKEYNELKDFHKRNPNEPVENLERSYKRRNAGDDGYIPGQEIDGMFTAEEFYGRYFDLITSHEAYLNLKGVKRVTYLQYLDIFDKFAAPQMPLSKAQKGTDEYFTYLRNLVQYLEDFYRRTRPLEDVEKVLVAFDEDFEKAWAAGEVPGWTVVASVGPVAPSTGVWCPDCQKDFKNENVFKAHLTGKKHIKAAEQRAQNGGGSEEPTGNDKERLREKAIADREFRISKLTELMSKERTDTRVNVERKQGMTERERQQEIEAFMAETSLEAPVQQETVEEDSDSDREDTIYNPLKLPLGWDGKPIPYWLYKLHGLGVEYSCEICGNFVYMGRRAFEKHFGESRHVYGLKCLGVTNTSMFREVTGIEDAVKLWEKIQVDKKKQTLAKENIVQMEDAEGNVMPEKVYRDLQKAGIL